MRKITVITAFTLSALLLALMTVPAMAGPPYAIDGDLHDWGLDELYIGISGTDTDWLPDSSTAYFVVEDNIDPRYCSSLPFGDDTNGFETWYDGTEGVHIKRDISTTGSNEPYYEPKINDMYYQPSGGEISDLEALYVDSTPSTIYFAIIHSIRGQDGQSPELYMGDLGIKIGDDMYGIVLNGDNKGDVYLNPSWTKTGDSPNPWPGTWGRMDNNAPWRVQEGTGTKLTCKADVKWGTSLPQDNYHVYSSTPQPDIHSGENYVIEISVPASCLNNPRTADLKTMCWCANDVLNLGTVNFEIPEFTTIAVPACMILGMFYFFRRKRQTE